jgi:hypothetical protein
MSGICQQHNLFRPFTHGPKPHAVRVGLPADDPFRMTWATNGFGSIGAERDAA